MNICGNKQIDQINFEQIGAELRNHKNLFSSFEKWDRVIGIGIMLGKLESRTFVTEMFCSSLLFPSQIDSDLVPFQPR